MTDFSQTAAGGTIPTPYIRGPAPLSPDGYPVYIGRELDKIAKAIRTLVDLAPQAAIKAPARPIENMIRFAKSPWRPVSGQTQDKWVTYVAGSWNYLSSE
jgi:hypothetical protein